MPDRSFLLFLLVFRTTNAACSDPPAFALPVTDVQLSNGFAMRGTPMSIGSPPQNFSIMPHTFLNDTWVYNSSAPFCFNGTTDAQCYTQRGGQYTLSDSSTAQHFQDVYAAGGDPTDTFRQIQTHIWYSDWATDDLRLGNTTLGDFPIGMPGFDIGEQFDTQGNIGLGQNSTVLNALKAANHISSRSYSYWWGKNSAAPGNAMDGQIVFGGYDAAKVTGPNLTEKLLPWSLTCPSGMMITISSLLLGFPNGTKADMLSPSVIPACLQPDFPVLITPKYEPYFEAFINFTNTNYINNSIGVYWWTPLYDPTDVYQGDLTIGMDQGLSVTVPNDLLVVPDAYVAPSGQYETNNSAAALLIQPAIGDNVVDVAILGRPFLSSAYLMVDLDAQTFTLWQANATTDERLVTVGGNCDHAPEVNDAPSNATTATVSAGSSASSPASEASQSGTSNERMSTGATAGIAIGVALCLGIIAAGTAILIIRKKRRAASAASQASVAYNSYGNGPGDEYEAWKHSSPLQRYPQEMSATQDQSYELLTHERPLEAPGGPWDSKPVELPSGRYSKPDL